MDNSNHRTMSNDVGMNSSRSSFTEAVPLSLSSLAHLTVPLDEGVMNGIREMVQHTQLACVNYARATSVNQYSLKELWVDDWVWTKRSAKDQLPPPLVKLNCFKHSYVQQVKLCLGQPEEGAVASAGPDASWIDDKLVLGTISFYYCSEELFTDEELSGDMLNDDDTDGDGDDAMNNDDDDMPNCILYKVAVEYRSLPPTENQVAVEAEELSMLSFGGSVDDAVKYGALASLYDEHAKYAMEICSVRGRKYKFDLMDSTLSDGRLPRWRPKQGVAEPPFTKSLCVTVTDHIFKDSISRLSLTLEGALRKPKDFHPSLHFYTKKLEESFLLWRKSVSIMALPSRQSLLLNADLAGQVYVDGRYMTTWGKDAKIGTAVEALFGIDVHSIIPVWHGRIVDYDVLKQVYATAWQEVMIDSRLKGIDLANMLLYRLMYGKDESEVYDDEDDAVDTSQPTLESQVMSSSKYDPVGICAKALATRFAIEFGKEAFPVLAHEVQAVRQQLGHRTPVVVPARLISVLRRGGYSDMTRTIHELWFTEGVRAAESEAETALLASAVQLLNEAGVDDVLAEHVMFVKFVDPHPEKHYNLCRYQADLSQYYLNEEWATASTPFWVALAIARAHPEGGLVEKGLLEKHMTM